MTIFDNCIIQAPDSTPLSRCSLSKANWYVRRELADIVANDPITIKLRFEPSGRAGASDKLMLAGKPNHCVVCGSVENLTRHHVIPSSFIKHMAIEYKVDIIRDILPLCRDCHDIYEKNSQDKRSQIANQMGLCVNGVASKQIGLVRRATGAAHALLNHQDKIPEERRTKLLKMVQEFLGKTDVNTEELKAVADHKITLRRDYINFSKQVADSVDDYNEFAKEWRTHFVEVMKPKYLPETWSINRKTENVWIPARMLRQITIPENH